MSNFSSNKSTAGALLRRAFSLLTGLSLLGLSWSFSPVTTQASSHLPRPAAIQVPAGIKLYLPLISRRLPTFEERLLDLINAERTARGLTALSADSTLMQVAEAHSRDMRNRDFFNHINPDGLGPGDRLDNAGYRWQRWGEIIGAAYATPQAMLNGWMNSPGHRANLLNPNFSEIGLGYVSGGEYDYYWTAVFAKPQ
ncbi:MAG TPA: CAP domain-containing protein [Anaerolineae bacterium]|nr:CAP domain-containing protein [Anaerolineae bacterium]HXW01587.1 CAP domain-containing protein [Anaerolineae bacterium]